MLGCALLVMLAMAANVLVLGSMTALFLGTASRAQLPLVYAASALFGGVVTLALGFSWAVELSQIYHAPWIDWLRATIPGRLVLGTTFNAIDLAAYAAGIAIGAGCEMIWRRRGCG